MAMSVLLFSLAVALLFVAHVLRCYRQTLLFPDRVLPWRFELLLGLSLSHFVNVLLPWRVGDIVRVVFVASRYRLRLSYVGATVAAERVSDVVVVVLLALLLLSVEQGSAAVLRSLVFLLCSVLLAMLLLAVLVDQSRNVRRLAWRFASFFNDRVRFVIVDLVWSFSQLVVGGSLVRPRFLLLSVAMWAFYLGSYAVFAVVSDASLIDVGMTLLGGPNRPLLQQIAESGIGRPALALLGFTALPVLAVLAYGVVRNRGQLFRAFSHIRQFGFRFVAIEERIAGDRFTAREDYGTFLQSHFSGSNTMVSRLGLIASADVQVRRLLPGGSDAVTALIQQADAIKIRKCAIGGAADKLAEQANWLREQGSRLPLCSVIQELRSGATYSYDMPYLISARDFYEVIHTSPLSESFSIIGEVVDTLHDFHVCSSRGDADQRTIDDYLQKKVIANARLVHEFASDLLGERSYRVNGAEYDLEDWQRLFDLDWLRAQIVSRETSVIHGDLTIENIIVSSEVDRGWYIIDPNPDNVFNTPLIDWAKLMQSLHLGYEGLNRGGQPELSDNNIKLLFLRSGAYSNLHEFLGQKLALRLGVERMREIAFHEIVNYLRLTPYKIRHQPQKALTFFACTSLLLQRYLNESLPAARPYSGAPRANLSPAQNLQVLPR